MSRATRPPLRPGCANRAAADSVSSRRNTSPVTRASPSAVCRPTTSMPSRAAMASSECSSWSGWTAASSSKVSRTGWVNRTPVGCLLESEELHVEADVVTDEHGVGCVAGELGQHGVERRLAGEHLPGEAVHGGRDCRHRAPRVHEPLEGLLPQQAPVHHADRAHGDDLVTLGRLQAGGLGVEDRVRELVESAVVPGQGLLLPVEEAEVVELRSAARRRSGGGPRGAGAASVSGRAGSRCGAPPGVRPDHTSPPWRATTSRAFGAAPPVSGSSSQAWNVLRRGCLPGPGRLELRVAAQPG